MSQKPRFDSDLWLLGGQNENVLFNSPKPHRSDPNVLGGQEIRQGVKSLPRVGDWPGCRPTHSLAKPFLFLCVFFFNSLPISSKSHECISLSLCSGYVTCKYYTQAGS